MSELNSYRSAFIRTLYQIFICSALCCCGYRILLTSLIPHHLHIFSSKANVMLEYDIDEAQALLEQNLSTASRNLETLEEDLDFLRDQFTTTEVSILPLCSLPRQGLLQTSHRAFIVMSLLAHSSGEQRSQKLSFCVMLNMKYLQHLIQ